MLASVQAAGANRSLGPAVAGLAAAHPGQSGVLLVDTGEDALRLRDALIESATRTIDAQYYIWNSDVSGRYMAARLLAAAGRGVEVRVLLDDVNVAGRDATIAALAEHPNVEIRIYNPNDGRSGMLRWFGFLREFSQLNRRMHNKSFTVDGAVSIVGGRNIGDEYFDLHPGKNFRDRELLVAGPVVDEVSRGFEDFWNSEWTHPVEKLAGGPVPLDGDLAAVAGEMKSLGYTPEADPGTRIVTDTLPALLWAPVRAVLDAPPTEEAVEASDSIQPVAAEIRRLITSAREEVLVESAYFILGDEGLEDAARLHESGVDMRVLTNSLASNDLVTNHSGYARRRESMLDAGIELHELRPDAPACRRLVTLSTVCAQQPAFSLHSKSIVVDRRFVYVGSFNVNLRSTYLNSETALIVDSPELAEQIAKSIVELQEEENSWRVTRGADDDLQWVTRVDGVEVRDTREPMTETWRRIGSRVFRLFPMEKYL